MAYTPTPADNELIANLPGDIREVNTKVDNLSTEVNGIDTEVDNISTALSSHIANANNPHNTTAAQVGAAAASHTHSDATTSASGYMSAGDKTKLNNIALNANNYSHPTGDGNLHVPATGTNNSGKVLTAGSSAGSSSWQSLPQGMTLNTSVTVTGSTETAKNQGANAYGVNFSSQLFNEITGVAGGTYTLQNVIQELINKSHTHTLVSGNNYCSCNCGSGG